MKHDLIYDDFKQYELNNWKGKELFDNAFKFYSPYSYSHRFRFENNYGASVIKHFGSYGFEGDLFELAVIRYNPKNKNSIGDLCYDTPITNDVIGYLTNDEVLELLEKIKNL